MAIDERKLAETISDILGAMAAHDAFIAAASRAMGPSRHPLLMRAFAEEAEAARTHLLHSAKHDDRQLATLDAQLDRIAAMLRSLQAP